MQFRTSVELDERSLFSVLFEVISADEAKRKTPVIYVDELSRKRFDPYFFCLVPCSLRAVDSCFRNRRRPQEGYLRAPEGDFMAV